MGGKQQAAFQRFLLEEVCIKTPSDASTYQRCSPKSDVHQQLTAKHSIMIHFHLIFFLIEEAGTYS